MDLPVVLPFSGVCLRGTPCFLAFEGDWFSNRVHDAGELVPPDGYTNAATPCS